MSESRDTTSSSEEDVLVFREERRPTLRRLVLLLLGCLGVALVAPSFMLHAAGLAVIVSAWSVWLLRRNERFVIHYASDCVRTPARHTFSLAAIRGVAVGGPFPPSYSLSDVSLAERSKAAAPGRLCLPATYSPWTRRLLLSEGAEMLFMIIERFRDNDMVPIYRKVRDSGRMLPEGLKYLDSWIEPNFGRCFQLMECDDLRRLQEWTLQWRGSGVAFEIVPVVTSKQTREVVTPYLDAPEG